MVTFDADLMSARHASAFLALLDKVAADRAWEKDAACRGADQALFFGAPGRHPAEALAICDRCPVRAQCEAVSPDEVYGVWAGRTTEERRDFFGRRRTRSPE